MSTEFENAVEFLDSLQMFGIKLGLEQVDELLAGCGNPHERLRFIHIAGSNGKGSFAAMTGAALRQAGFKVGFFSSPHLISVRERFRIDGQAISKCDFALLVSELRPVAEQMASAGRCPTYFEFCVAVAALYFAGQGVDFVLWETGMGGRLDATNIVDPYCSVITGIALEHQQYLGTTIAAIAGEKAGIIKSSRPVFTGNLVPQAMAVVEATAHERGSEIFSVDSSFAVSELNIGHDDSFYQSFKMKGHYITLPLAGPMQRENVKLVFMVLSFLANEFSFDLKTALSGIADARWPGRLQVLPDGSVLDGAHNPDGVEKLLEALSEIYSGEKFTIIFAAFADKDTAGALRLLDKIAETFIFLPLHGPSWRKVHSAQELKNILKDFSDTPAFTVGSIEEALALPYTGKRLITGSLYLAGDALKHFMQEEEIINI